MNSGVMANVIGPLAREAGGVAGIYIEEVARRFRGEIRGEEVDGLRDVFGIDRALEERALAIEVLELVFLDPVRLSALLAPFALPNLRSAQNRIRVHDVDANAERRAFERHAAGNMNFSGLGGTV